MDSIHQTSLIPRPMWSKESIWRSRKGEIYLTGSKKYDLRPKVEKTPIAGSKHSESKRQQHRHCLIIHLNR